MATAAKTPPAEANSAPGVHPKPFWSFKPRSDREAGDAIVANFALHWFPAKVFKPSLDWNYSFWLGTISAALLLLLVVSGLPLLFLYVPSVERAYGSVKDRNSVASSIETPITQFHSRRWPRPVPFLNAPVRNTRTRWRKTAATMRWAESLWTERIHEPKVTTHSMSLTEP